MAMSIDEYIGDFEVALIELTPVQRDASVRELKSVIRDMEHMGMNSREIIRELGPVKRLARDYLRKYGSQTVLERVSEGIGQVLGNTPRRRAAKETEYYIRFYNRGLFRISQRDLDEIGRWSIIGQDAYRIFSVKSDLEIVAWLETKNGLTDRDYELINAETMARY